MSTNIIITSLDRDKWTQFPVGTKVYGINGGFYTKVMTGWQWLNGNIFPNPSADWSRIELPFTQEEVDKSYNDIFGNSPMYEGLKNCKHEMEPEWAGVRCKHCYGWNVEA